MADINEMKKELIPDYEERLRALNGIAYQLYKLDETDLFEQVMKKIAGTKMLLDHCKNIE